MSSLITLEDVNTVNINPINEFYVLDTSNISLQEFNGVLYDFTIVNHSISGNNHTFTFEVKNKLWVGGYYLTKSNGTYINSNASYSNGVISFTTTEASIQLHLYLCNFASFQFKREDYILVNDADSIFNIKINDIGTQKIFKVHSLVYNQDYDISIRINNSGAFVLSSNPRRFVYANLIKSDLLLDLSEVVLTVGEVNKVYLNVDDDFLPNGDLTAEDYLDLEVIYNNVSIPVTYDETANDYYFELDLTNKINNNHVKLQLNCNEIDVVNAEVFDFTLPCVYPSVNDFAGLQSALVHGSKIIELDGDVTFNNDLELIDDLHIIGDENNIIMDNHSIYVPVGKSLKLSDCDVVSGNPAIVQAGDSNVILENCEFRNCSISVNYKGSVLTGENNASITNCKFINCHHSIYFNGDLDIENCQAVYDEYNSSVDNDYPALLTLYGGNCIIKNSIFDIDFNTNELCSNEIDIKFAQSLIGVSEDSVFNDMNGNLLMANDCLPFFDNKFNNRSHVYCKYYYPEISECVITSPKTNYEDMAVMHSIIGEDYVFKNNTQITKASQNRQNETRKILWE